MHPKSSQMAQFASLIVILFAFSQLSNATTITWVGGVGNWNVASNWSTGFIPTATDEVLISSGRVTIPHYYTAHAIQVTIENYTKLTISSSGTLVIANTMNQDAITVYGTMINFGQVSISDIFYSNNSFYLDAIDITGRLVNLGDINLSNPYYKARGLYVRGSLDNRGDINMIEGGRAIYLNGGAIKNRINGIIYTQDCAGTISSTSSSLAIENEGDIIALNNTASAEIHLRSDFENNVSGRIILLNSNTVYGIDLAGASFENEGEIIIDGSSFGIHNDGTFENKEDGNIATLSGSNSGIYNFDYFINKGRIILDEGSLHGIVNASLFENKPEGYIFFQEIENHQASSFQNEGELDQSALLTAYGGLDNRGSFNNHHCAKFYMRQNLRNYLTGVIINEGLMTYENTSTAASLNDGIMENHGVLEDNIGGLYPLVFNQKIIARELPGPLAYGGIVSNALTLGSLSSYTIEGWYTSSKLAIDAGIYFTSSNAFMPNSFAVGLSTLYVKANDVTGGCPIVFEVNFSNSFAGGGNSLLSEFGGSSTSSNNFIPYPNPTTGTFHLRLPDDQEGFYEWSLIDLTGRILLKKSTVGIMNGTVTVTPETSLPNGSYLLQITQNGQLIKSEKVVVIR